MAIGGARQAKKEKSGSQESAKETSKHARFLDFWFPILCEFSFPVIRDIRVIRG
jgi:hypothetical protein